MYGHGVRCVPTHLALADVTETLIAQKDHWTGRSRRVGTLNAVNTMLGTTIDNAARTAAGIRNGRTRPLQRRPQPPSRKTGSDPGPAGDCLPCVKRRALAADET